MAERVLSEEIINLLNEKYLFRIKQDFSEVDHGTLVFIYVRLLCVYDDVNYLNCDLDKQFWIDPNSDNLKHIIRCLRPLGLAYLVTKQKDLLVHVTASKIIFALHDKVTSKFGKNISQRVRAVVKKELLQSKANQRVRRTKPGQNTPHVTENTFSEDSELLPEEKQNGEHLPTTDDDFFAVPCAPGKRIIPGGWQIPRTPMKEESEREMTNIVPPPPPAFTDSPDKKMKETKHLENASAFVLTPPSEFCDKTLDSFTDSLSPDSPEAPEVESSKRRTYVLSRKSLSSSDEASDNSGGLTSAENSPDVCLNKRRTYCIPKSPSEKDDPVIDKRKTYCIPKSPSKKDNPGIDKRKTYCIPKSPSEKDNPGIDKRKTYSIPKFPSKNDNPGIDKRKTYCIPRESVILEEKDMEVKTVNEETQQHKTKECKNKRKTSVVPALSTSFENNSKNYSYTQQKNKNISIIDMETPAKVKPLFVNLLKGEISFVECRKGVIPNGRELIRTPPMSSGNDAGMNLTYLENPRCDESSSLDTSVDSDISSSSIVKKLAYVNDTYNASKLQSDQMGNLLSNCDINTEMESGNGSVDQSLVNDSLSVGTSSHCVNETILTDSAFVINDTNSVVFDDSMALFPVKKNEEKRKHNSLLNDKKNTEKEMNIKPLEEEAKIEEQLLNERDPQNFSEVKMVSTEEKGLASNIETKPSNRKLNQKIQMEDLTSIKASDGRTKYAKKKTIAKNKLDAVEERTESETEKNIPKGKRVHKNISQTKLTEKEDDVLTIECDDDKESELEKELRRIPLVKSVEEEEEDLSIIERKKHEENVHPVSIEMEANPLGFDVDEEEVMGDKILKKTRRTTAVKSVKQNDVEISDIQIEPKDVHEVNYVEEKKEKVFKKRTKRTIAKLLLQEETDEGSLDIENKDIKANAQLEIAENKDKDLEESNDAVKEERKIKKATRTRRVVNKKMSTKLDKESSDIEKEMSAAKAKTKLTEKEDNLDEGDDEIKGKVIKKRTKQIAVKSKSEELNKENENSDEDTNNRDSEIKIENKPKKELEEIITKDILKPLKGFKKKPEKDNIKSNRRKDTKMKLNIEGIIKLHSKQKEKEIKENEDYESSVSHKMDHDLDVEISEKGIQTSKDQNEFKKPEPRRTQRGIKSKLSKINSYEDFTNLKEYDTAIDSAPDTKTRSGSIKSRSKIKQISPPPLEEEDDPNDTHFKVERSNSKARKKEEISSKTANIELKKRVNETPDEKHDVRVPDEKRIENNTEPEVPVDTKDEVLPKEDSAKSKAKAVNPRKRNQNSKVKLLIEKFNNVVVESKTNSKQNYVGKENLVNGKEPKKRVTKKSETFKTLEKASLAAPISLAENNARPSRRCKISAKTAISQMLNESD